MSEPFGSRDWHQTQNRAYLDLLEKRLLEPPLTWVTQFVELINAEVADGPLRPLTSVAISDYGCSVGHFFRCVQDVCRDVTYRGFDVSDTYLDIARRHFKTERFQQLDISSPFVDLELPHSDVAIVSATLEHIEDHQRALRNIFSHTKHLVLLRTFVGTTPLTEWCRTIGAEKDYLIKQFTIGELTEVPAELGYSVFEVIDRATMGKTKMVCNSGSVPRRQAILVFTKSSASSPRPSITNRPEQADFAL